MFMGADKTHRPHDRIDLLLAAHLTKDISILNILKILLFKLEKLERIHFSAFLEDSSLD